MCARVMTIANVEPSSQSSHSEGQTPSPNSVSPVAAVAAVATNAPVTADLVVEAPEVKKSPAASFVLSSPCDAVATDAATDKDKDERIRRLEAEVAQLRKVNDKLTRTISESSMTDGDSSKPKSMEQLVVSGFKTMFNSICTEATSTTNSREYVLIRYMFQFKNGKLQEYLFEGKGEKKKDHPHYDHLTQKERDLIKFYLRHKKAPGAKLEFYRREGHSYSIMDYVSALESESKDEARKLIDGDTTAVLRAVYAMFSACCRRLFDITYILNKNLKSVTMRSVQRITPTITKTLFFESVHPGFNDLEAEDRKKFSVGKGIMYSTMFFMPDGEYLKECFDGLFDMLDVLKVLTMMDC